MINEQLIEDLKKEEKTTFHDAVLKHVRERVEMGHAPVCGNFDFWDKQDQLYRGERNWTKEDAEAARKNEPSRVEVPLTKAQVHTFIAFNYLIFLQERYGFEFRAPSETTSSYSLEPVVNAIIDRNFRKNTWEVLLYQHLLDIARFSLGVFKADWHYQEALVPRTTEQPVTALDGSLIENTTEETEELVKFDEYCRIQSVSPYRAFFDPRWPIKDFQRGEFCFTEIEFSKHELLDMEARGEIYGMKYVTNLGVGSNQVSTRGQTRFERIRTSDKQSDPANAANTCITEMFVRLHRNSLGEEHPEIVDHDDARIYLVWMANDDRIVRIQEYTNPRRKFPLFVAQLSPDDRRQINESLTSILQPMQAWVSFLFNSRAVSVKRNLDHQLIADGKAIDISALRSRSPLILTKPGWRGTAKDAVHQLTVQDVTQSHLADAANAKELAQAGTGVSDMAMGNFHRGRRSATEARGVVAGAASRLKLYSSLIFAQSLAPVTDYTLACTRKYLSEEAYDRIITPPDPQMLTEAVPWMQRRAEFFADDYTLLTDEGFFVFNPTSDIENQLLAQSLQELFGIIASNPGFAQAFDIDPKAVLNEILYRRGLGQTNRFSLQAKLLNAQSIQTAIGAGGPAGPQGQSLLASPGAQPQGASQPGTPQGAPAY